MRVLEEREDNDQMDDKKIQKFRQRLLEEYQKLIRSINRNRLAEEEIKLENTEDETQSGDIVVESELALPSKQDYGTGALTKRIATSRLRGETKSSQKYEEVPAGSGETHATIEYEDSAGRQTYRITKDQIVIGRGGRQYWTDLTLNTLPDVSREHIRLRRDPATSKFYLKDLSRLGTTIDGEKVPSSIEYSGSEKRDKNLEVELPASAEGQEMRRLRAEMHRRMLGNGYCARPVGLDCHFESICESCTFFQTTLEFRPTLERQRDDARAKGQVGRQRVFDGLLQRLEEAS